MTKKYGERESYSMGRDFSPKKHLHKPSGLHHDWKGIQTEVTLPSDKARQSQQLRELKAIASQEGNKANKRIERLQNKGMETPALTKWLDAGGKKFSVAGKDYNQTQAELARIRQFNNAKTSTIRGANEVLKNMAKNIGRENTSLSQLQSEASQFFRLADKVEQYLNSMNNVASAIGYQEIWESINSYTDEQQIELSELRGDVDLLAEAIAQEITVARDIKILNAETDSGGYVFIN